MGEFKEAALTHRQQARLEQSALLSTPEIRSLWTTLTEEQQRLVHVPIPSRLRPYPLTAAEVSELTGLEEQMVCHYADHGAIPCWTDAGERQFESAGLIRAFALANAHANDPI